MVKVTTPLKHQEIVDYNEEGHPVKKIGSSFYRGDNVNLNPYLRDFRRDDFLEKFVMKGWMPESRFIDHNTRITAFGSCFAENITKYLSALGFSLSRQRNPDIYISTMGEGLVNVHALAQQFEWALDDVAPPEGLWQGFKAEEFGYDEDIRQRTRDAMLGTDFFIITLGLSEVWYDEMTGGVFWRAVPRDRYDPQRHKFKVCSLAETKDKLELINNCIRRHVPHAKVLFTLSPVPLAATFRPASCLTANSSSKAILRACLDEFLRDNQAEINQRLFYFPSYEIIMDLFFSRYIPDGRHPHSQIIQIIMKLFEATYCDTSLSISEVSDLYHENRKDNGKIAFEDAEGRA